MTTLKVDGQEIDYSGLPAQCRETVRLFLEHGINPGTGCLMILEHDLMAVRYCDCDTVAHLPEIMLWLRNHAPSRSHGSAAKVEVWMRERRAARIPELQPITTRPVELTAPELQEN